MRKEEVDKLLERYYNGLSTSEEEQMLKDFFNQNDIPERYESEKALFGHYSFLSEIPEVSGDFEKRIISSLDPIPSRASRKILVLLSGIAAGVAILIGSWFFLARNEPVDTFADPDLAYAETVKILYEVSAMMNSGTEELDPIKVMNMDEIQKLGIFSNSRQILEKTLPDLNGIMKVTGIPDNAEKNEKIK